MGEFLFFVLALLIGIALGWYLQMRFREDERVTREAQYDAQLKQLHEEIRQADSAHAETKERLIALQHDHQRLESELARLRAGDGAAVPPTAVPDAAPPVAGAAPPAEPATAADDLTRIKGIGRVLQKKLEAMGITTFRQLAELSPPEVNRINEAIDFPGRVQREQWVKQARSLMAS